MIFLTKILKEIQVGNFIPLGYDNLYPNNPNNSTIRIMNDNNEILGYGKIEGNQVGIIKPSKEIFKTFEMGDWVIAKHLKKSNIPYKDFQDYIVIDKKYLKK